MQNYQRSRVIDPKQRDSCYVALVGGFCLYLGPSKICMPVDVYCLPSATCPEDWDDIDRKNNLSGSTASLDSWRQAKQWLRTCSKEHDKCRPRAEALPTRLLDLKVIANRDVKLLNSSDIKVADGMLRFSNLFVIPYGTDCFWLQTYMASAMLV